MYLQALATAFRLGILGDVTWLYARAATTVAFIDELDHELTDPPERSAGRQALPGHPGATTRPATALTAEVAGTVRLERVTFCYPTVDRPSVEDVSVTIPAGESVAIVGRNGAGKSTLVKLLCGLYASTRGSLLVGGVDSRSEASGTSGVAAIFQTFTHFETTLADSIALGAPGVPVTREHLETALGDAGGASLLEAGVGWDTMFSAAYDGGRDLSGGQWQRVALARALYAMHAGAQVLVLDEPTAAMDIHAETDLFARFREVCRGTTTVLVTHRLATVRHVDRILVLERGRLVEDGSHHELMSARGLYAQMFSLQAAQFDRVMG